MGKGLCIATMIIALLVLLLFGADLVLTLIGMQSLAPFRGASLLVSGVFTVCAGAVAYLCWATLREQMR